MAPLGVGFRRGVVQVGRNALFQSTPSNSGELHFPCQKLYLAPRCAGLLTARYVPNSSWFRVGHDPIAGRIVFHRGFPRQGVMPRILIYPHILYPILKATRLHVRVCGVLCIRPSSEIHFFWHPLFSRSVTFYRGWECNVMRLATGWDGLFPRVFSRWMSCAMNMPSQRESPICPGYIHDSVLPRHLKTPDALAIPDISQTYP